MTAARRIDYVTQPRNCGFPKMLRTIALSLTLMLTPIAALANPDIAAPVIERIESQGYTVEEVRRSWLGRLIITARNKDSQREIVLNRKTGEVLRDTAFPTPRQDTIGTPSAPRDALNDALGSGIGAADGGLLE